MGCRNRFLGWHGFLHKKYYFDACGKFNFLERRRQSNFLTRVIYLIISILQYGILLLILYIIILSIMGGNIRFTSATSCPFIIQIFISFWGSKKFIVTESFIRFDNKKWLSVWWLLVSPNYNIIELQNMCQKYSTLLGIFSTSSLGKQVTAPPLERSPFSLQFVNKKGRASKRGPKSVS